MSATLVTPKTTSGGEIIRELVNATDGAGLHFDGAAGAISLGSSMPDLGSKYSFEFVVKGDSRTGETYLLDAYNSSSTNRVILAWSGSSNGNIQLHVNGTWSSAFIATPDNGEVLHLLLSVDGTSATLYQNGNSVSTQTVVANTLTGATNTHIGASQNGSGNFFNGTIYRARFWNKLVDAKALFERADVDFADQYGSQTNKISAAVDKNWGTNQADTGNDANDRATFDANYAWTVNGTSVVDISVASNVLTFSARYNKHGIYYNASLVAGKRQRITLNVTTVGTDEFALYYYTGSAYALITTLVAGENSVEFVPTATNGYVYLGCTKDHASAKQIVLNAASIANSIVLCGCVSDYDLAFANPTQSLMVQDRAGAADGTAHTSGVTQVQPIIQGNLTSLAVTTSQQAAGVPADGKILADSLGIGSGATFDDSQAAIVGGDNVGLALQSTHSGKTSRIRFFDHSGNQDATVGFANDTSNLFMGTGTAAHLTIDTNGRVHVGTGTASQVNLNVTGTTGNGGVMQNALTSGFITSGTNLGSYGFKGTDSANTNGAAEAKITAIAAANHSGTSAPTDLVFYTKPATAGPGNSPTEAMRIASTSAITIPTGPVTVGPTAGAGNATIAGSSSPGHTNQPGTNLLLKSGDGSGTGSSFITFSTPPAGSSGTSINAAVERMRVNGNGTVAVKGSTDLVDNIALEITNQSGVGKANIRCNGEIHTAAGIVFDSQTNSTVGGSITSTLAHYEQGTFTPTDGSGAGLTFTSVNCNYTRMGRVVILTGSFVFPATSSSSQARVTVGTLPFAAVGNTSGTMTIGTVSGGAGIDAAGYIRKENNGVFTNSELTGAAIYFNTTYITS